MRRFFLILLSILCVAGCKSQSSATVHGGVPSAEASSPTRGGEEPTQNVGDNGGKKEAYTYTDEGVPIEKDPLPPPELRDPNHILPETKLFFIYPRIEDAKRVIRKDYQYGCHKEDLEALSTEPHFILGPCSFHADAVVLARFGRMDFLEECQHNNRYSGYATYSRIHLEILHVFAGEVPEKKITAITSVDKLFASASDYGVDYTIEEQGDLGIVALVKLKGGEYYDLVDIPASLDQTFTEVTKLSVSLDCQFVDLPDKINELDELFKKVMSNYVVECSKPNCRYTEDLDARRKLIEEKLYVNKSKKGKRCKYLTLDEYEEMKDAKVIKDAEEERKKALDELCRKNKGACIKQKNGKWAIDDTKIKGNPVEVMHFKR